MSHSQHDHDDDEEFLELDDHIGTTKMIIKAVVSGQATKSYLENAAQAGSFQLEVESHEDFRPKAAQNTLLAFECRTVDAFEDLDTLRKFRQEHPLTPVVVVSVNQDADFILEAFRAGVTDYYDPNDDERVLAARVRVLNQLGSASRLIEVQNRELLANMAELRQEMENRRKAEADRAETREQLAEAAKNATLGEVAGSIAHEINTPLAVVLGCADMLEGFLDDSEPDLESARTTSAEILKMSERISSIIKGLKSFSRQGEADPFETVQMQEIISEALALCEEQMERKGITIECDVPADLTFDCQPTQVSQVLLNLLSNARHATEKSDNKVIKIKVEGEGDEVTLTVTDSGCGIPEEIAQKVFEPYFTTKPKGIGTGLGLSINSKILKAHDGTFQLRSRQNPTIFAATFPKVCKPEKKNPAPVQEAG